MGHPVVTNEDFVAYLFSAVRGGDAALPTLLCDFLLVSLQRCETTGWATEWYPTCKICSIILY